jgi:hypothetical protein
MLDIKNSIRVEKKKYKNNSHTKTWVFLCDCGEEYKAQYSHLKTHKGKCKSCVQRGKPYEAIYNELIASKHLKIGGICLTYKEFLEVISTKECHYCKTPMHWFPHTKDKGKEIKGSRAYQIDRKYNDLGYTKENCVPCCWVCNRLKSDVFLYEEFLEIGKLIEKFRKNRKDMNVEDFISTTYCEKYAKELNKNSSSCEIK